EMVQHARAELPNECCGMLAGTPDGRIVCRDPLVNEAASPKEDFSEPRSMFIAEKDRRGRGIEFLAVYHSHPTSEPVPSKTDLERSYSSLVVNLIISLKDGDAQMRGWWMTETDYTETDWDWIEND